MGLNKGVRLDESGPQVVEVNQVDHGFVLPAHGFIPAVYNNSTGDYEPAQANAITTAADVFITNIIDDDNFEIQEDSILEVESHGLELGIWYVTSATTAGAIDAYDDVTGSEAPIQYLCFVIDADTLLLRMDPLYIQPFIPQDVAIVNDWTQGANPALGAGEDRLLIVGVNWEDDGGTTLVSSIEVGGEIGTLLVEQSIISGFQYAASYYYFTEAQIAAMSGSAITINWTNGTPLDFQESTVMLENVDQDNPIVAVNSDSGTGSPDTLDADVNTIAGGYAFASTGGGNGGIGFTNNGAGWTRKLDLTITSADGVVDDKFISSTATPENVNFTLTGSNRQVLVAGSIRRRES